MIPPQQGGQLGEGCHPFRKYSHNMYHFPIYYINLLLRPLIMNFLCHCYKFVTTGRLSFSEEEYKQSVEFQTEWIHCLKTWINRYLNPDEIVLWKDRIMINYVALGILYVSSYPLRSIKNIFTIIEWVDNTGIIFYITPHPSI